MQKLSQKYRPRLERLEHRLALSAAANVVLVANGTVSTAGVLARLPVEITSSDLLAGRSTTIFGLSVQADAGSGLEPRIVSAEGPDGRRLPLRFGSGSPEQGRMTVFVKDSIPGTVTLRVSGQHRTTGGFVASLAVVGDINGDGRVDLADEAAFTPAYQKNAGNPHYNPAADANSNRFVGQPDALALVHNLTPPTRPIPLSLIIGLAPQDRPTGHISEKNSGGFTYKSNVTVKGRTTPGSFIFTDTGLGDYSFRGPIYHADANGDFAIPEHLSDALTNFEFLIVDPFGHRLIRAFPIRRL
jgi:hypothetical protein